MDDDNYTWMKDWQKSFVEKLLAAGFIRGSNRDDINFVKKVQIISENNDFEAVGVEIEASVWSISILLSFSLIQPELKNVEKILLASISLKPEEAEKSEVSEVIGSLSRVAYDKIVKIAGKVANAAVTGDI